jgi:hypothetical protein
MLRLTESALYRRIKPVARSAGLVPDRIENAISEGWPDVLLRGLGDLHLYAELKIARGALARIKVRPEQINWAEDHASRGGRVWLLAWFEKDPNLIWALPSNRIRACAQTGCLAEPAYRIKDLRDVFRHWMGHDVHLQPQDPPPVQVRTRLASKARRSSPGGTVLPSVRRTRIRNSGDHGGPHSSESAWWVG